MILVLLRTGIRIGELLRLRVSDVYLPERRIHLVVGEKNRTGRVVYLSSGCLSGVAGMDEEARGGKTVALLWPGAKLLELYGRPGDVSAVPKEGRESAEGLFVAWSSAYLCHGVVECRDAPGVFAAGVRAQQPGADPAICAVNR